MGKASRDKGKRRELEACEALADVWPGLKRIYGQARMGSDAPDIDGPGCPVWIEVKGVEQLSIHAAMAQAVNAVAPMDLGYGEGWIPRPPVIVHKRNRGEWLVTVRARDLRRLINAGKG